LAAPGVGDFPELSFTTMYDNTNYLNIKWIVVVGCDLQLF